MSFWGEVRRRKVFQVAVTYAVVSWLLVQVATNVSEPLSLPPWFESTVIVLLALGFPVAIVLAWAFQLTPEGFARTDAIPGAGQRAPRGAPLQLALTALIAAAIGAGGAWWLLKPPDRRWILEDAVPEIEADIDRGDFESAHRALREALAIAPTDPDLLGLAPRVGWVTSISSEPPGARVSRRAYRSDPAYAEDLGVTPLNGVRIPFGLSRLHLERDGFVPVDATVGGGDVRTELTLDEAGQNFAVGLSSYRLDTAATLDDGAKVRVGGFSASVLGQATEFNDFFLGRYEVTNAEFNRFVDDGGYRQPAYWREPFILDGAEISFEEAMARFVDSTGQTGPATWQAGDYPDGRADYPVSGISWFEAAAYARYRGEDLPTVYHWRQAVAPGALTWTIPVSNFETESLRAVGDGDAMSWAGAYDLLGNVREWTANPSGTLRATVGGSAADASFAGSLPWTLIDAWDRSSFNGFRTMRAADESTVMSRSRAGLPPAAAPPPFEPVSDEVYSAWSEVLFDYVAGPLDAEVERVETTRNWVLERITFNAAYGGERMVLYLYLPTSALPPYQTVVYWPGSAAVYLRSINDYTMALDFVIKSGRAVAFPVYKETFERGGGATQFDMTAPDYRDRVAATVKDLRRSIDYLETQSDIDVDKLAFFGHSWGAVNGATALAQEPRFENAIIYVGFPAGIAPEVHPRNALPRVHIPVLMIVGEFDPVVPRRASEIYFDAIGTPEPQKKFVVAPGGHFVTRQALTTEVLGWLDERFGSPLRSGG